MAVAPIFEQLECECGAVDCRLRLDSGRCAALVADEALEAAEEDGRGAYFGAVMSFSEIAQHLGLNSHQHAEIICNRALAKFLRSALERGWDAETVAPWLARLERSMR